MTIEKRKQKIREYSKAVVKSYWSAHRRVELLNIGAYDSRITRRFTGTLGGHALEDIRIVIFMDIVRLGVSFVLDKGNGNKTASLRNILAMLKDSNELRMVLKQEFCGEGHQFDELYGNQFDELYKEICCSFEHIENHDLMKRFKDARDKLIAHPEIKFCSEERRLYRLDDLGFLWGDERRFVDLVEKPILDIEKLVSSSVYAVDRYKEIDRGISESFWNIMIDTEK